MSYNESHAEIEKLIEEKLDKKLQELEEDKNGGKGRGVSRRKLLGVLGVGTLGAGMMGAPTGLAQAAQSSPSDNPGVIYAETADDIQPAIDELAEDQNGYATGGIVQLGAKTYYPETTIWLKRGVTLQGVRPASHQRNPYGEPYTSGTVISTRDMAEGRGDIDVSKGVNTYSHANPEGENWHPHFPVIANFRTQPYELQNRDPTIYESDHWGHQIGLKNVVIDSSEKQRWWDDGSKDATYFGVYDAVLIEHARNILMENVTTRNFLGYGGFFNGCRGLVDRGSKWQGGATDYHGAALHTNLGYPPDPTIYTDGIWDVDVRGPAPTVLLEGDFSHQFVAGGWSQATIKGEDHVFLGDEADYWNGDAPLTNPEHAGAVFVQELARTKMEGYQIEGNSKLDGLWANDRHLYLSNVFIKDTHTGINHVGRVPFEISNCKIGRSKIGLECGPNSPQVNGLSFAHCDEGINFNGNSNQTGIIGNIDFFDGVDVAFGSGNEDWNPIEIHNAFFGGADSAGDVGSYLTLHNPVDPNGTLE